MSDYTIEQARSFFENAIRNDERKKIIERLQNWGVVQPWKPKVAGQPAKGGERAVVKIKGQKRSPEAIAKVTNDLLAAIKKVPGERIEQIAKRMEVGTGELALSVKKLLKDKKIRFTGTRRATRYFPK